MATQHFSKRPNPPADIHNKQADKRPRNGQFEEELILVPQQNPQELETIRITFGSIPPGRDWLKKTYC